MTIEAKIILDSVAPNGVRITTSELLYPRFIHSELLTHRVFSRNAASSRAIPTPKKIDRIRKDVAKPSEWGMNVKGMQSAGALDPKLAEIAERIWLAARDDALQYAGMLCGQLCANCGYDHEIECHGCEQELKLDLHKQVANRILEPFDHIVTVVTTTKLNNHRKLRTEVDPITGRPMPDPTYFELATKWHAALDASKPCLLPEGAWHLPYVSFDEAGVRRIADADLVGARNWFESAFNRAPTGSDYTAVHKKVSVGRVARTSYMRSGEGDIAANIELHDRLAKAGHWSPFEAQATPIGGFGFSTFQDVYDSCNWCGAGQNKGAKGVLREHGRTEPDGSTHELICKRCALGHVTSGNFLGWAQYRKEFPGEAGGDD